MGGRRMSYTRFAPGCSSIPLGESLLRDGSVDERGVATVWACGTGMVTGAGDLRFRQSRDHLRLPVRAADKNGSGDLSRAAGSVSGHGAFGHCVLPLSQYSSSLLHDLSG